MRVSCFASGSLLARSSFPTPKGIGSGLVSHDVDVLRFACEPFGDENGKCGKRWENVIYSCLVESEKNSSGKPAQIVRSSRARRCRGNVCSRNFFLHCVERVGTAFATALNTNDDHGISQMKHNPQKSHSGAVS